MTFETNQKIYSELLKEILSPAFHVRDEDYKKGHKPDSIEFWARVHYHTYGDEFRFIFSTDKLTIGWDRFHTHGTVPEKLKSNTFDLADPKLISKASSHVNDMILFLMEDKTLEIKDLRNHVSQEEEEYELLARMANKFYKHSAKKAYEYGL